MNSWVNGYIIGLRGKKPNTMEAYIPRTNQILDKNPKI